MQDAAVAAQTSRRRGCTRPASRVVDELFAAIDAGGPFYVRSRTANDGARRTMRADDDARGQRTIVDAARARGGPTTSTFAYERGGAILPPCAGSQHSRRSKR